MPKIAKGKTSLYTEVPTHLIDNLKHKSEHFKISKNDIMESALIDWFYKMDNNQYPVLESNGIRKEAYRTYLAPDLKEGISDIAQMQGITDIDVIDKLLRIAFYTGNFPLGRTKDI